MNAYAEENIAQNYLEFLASKNGQIQKEILGKSIANRLKNADGLKILDAACGSGWLSGQLLKRYAADDIEACDGSKRLIEQAKNDFPDINFKIADLGLALPYSENFFDAVILNMAILDIDDLETAIKNLTAALRPSGRLIVTLPNPYYNYPIGVWKSGLAGKLKRQKPALRLEKPYFASAEKEKSPTWGKSATSFIKPLSGYINSITGGGFDLKYFEDIFSEEDSSNFDLKYQMHRFPLLLLLEFKKRLE